MKNIFLDMDLTLAKFPIKHGELGTKKYRLDEGFFSKLKPYTNIDKVNIAIREKNANNIYILSNSPTEQADNDKETWLNQYLPAIHKSNRIFNRGGLFADRTKADVAIEILGRTLTEKDILIDDCIKNCAQWIAAGGMAIRKRGKNDGINWQGKSIYRMTTLAEIIQSV